MARLHLSALCFLLFAAAAAAAVPRGHAVLAHGNSRLQPFGATKNEGVGEKLKHKSLFAAKTLRGGVAAEGSEAADNPVLAVLQPLLEQGQEVLAMIPGSFFLKGLGLSYLISSIGFIKTEYMVSYGYGLSMAAQAGLGLHMFRDSLSDTSKCLTLGVLAYGVRLFLFLLWRNRQQSFQERPAIKRASTSSGPPFAFWSIASWLYALLFVPCIYSLRGLPDAEEACSVLNDVTKYSLVAMWAGLLLETAADVQKSVAKKADPQSPVMNGLFSLCRHPNYLGEDMFWIAVWLSGAAAYGTVWWRWVLSCLGTVQILSVIKMTTKSLEKRQAERYSGDKQYQAWVSSTPVLLPLLGKKAVS